MAVGVGYVTGYRSGYDKGRNDRDNFWCDALRHAGLKMDGVTVCER